jgi:uncharacterized protein (TIGR03067 family)
MIFRRFHMLRTIGAVLTVCLLVAADNDKTDKERLQGAWRPTSGERGGAVQEEAKEHLLIFEGSTFTIKRGDQQLMKGTFTLDPSQTPKTIDMKITEGRRDEDKGKEVHGIYELTKDSLKWCTASPGSKDRPMEFATKAGSKEMLVVLKREK